MSNLERLIGAVEDLAEGVRRLVPRKPERADDSGTLNTLNAELYRTQQECFDLREKLQRTEAEASEARKQLKVSLDERAAIRQVPDLVTLEACVMRILRCLNPPKASVRYGLSIYLANGQANELRFEVCGSSHELGIEGRAITAGLPAAVAQLEGELKRAIEKQTTRNGEALKALRPAGEKTS